MYVRKSVRVNVSVSVGVSVSVSVSVGVSVRVSVSVGVRCKCAPPDILHVVVLIVHQFLAHALIQETEGALK